jgi:dimethylargininase
LAASAELPDAVFVEDTAVVVDEIAVITRPGAVSRRAELAAVSDALQAWRPLARIAAPATLDGGDVVKVGRTLYVGQSSRTNPAGAAQLQALLAPFGYTIKLVEVKGCLHLKSAVSAIDESRLLTNSALCDVTAFGDLARIEVAPEEPSAANVLCIADVVIIDAAYPRTAEHLRKHSIVVETTDLSELAKAEGAVTCCSIVFADPGQLDAS